MGDFKEFIKNQATYKTPPVRVFSDGHIAFEAFPESIKNNVSIGAFEQPTLKGRLADTIRIHFPVLVGKLIKDFKLPAYPYDITIADTMGHAAHPFLNQYLPSLFDVMGAVQVYSKVCNTETHNNLLRRLQYENWRKRFNDGFLLKAADFYTRTVYGAENGLTYANIFPDYHFGQFDFKPSKAGRNATVQNLRFWENRGVELPKTLQGLDDTDVKQILKTGFTKEQIGEYWDPNRVIPFAEEHTNLLKRMALYCQSMHSLIAQDPQNTSKSEEVFKQYFETYSQNS